MLMNFTQLFLFFEYYVEIDDAFFTNKDVSTTYKSKEIICIMHF